MVERLEECRVVLRVAGRLDGRRAVVIGGARGIGEGIVAALVREGASVTLADLLDVDGERVAASFPGKVHFRRADISRRADMQALAAACDAESGGADILVQVAGIYPDQAIEDITEEDWDRVLGVNLKGPFLAIQAFFPIMKRQGYGRIVLTGSITGPHVAWWGHSHYASSKAALVGLARSAALEGAASGITVNVVEPGNVDTPNLRRERGDAHMAAMAGAVPMKRLATPDEIGRAVSFYASEDAAYVTGTALVIDGGQILPEARL